MRSEFDSVEDDILYCCDIFGIDDYDHQPSIHNSIVADSDFGEQCVERRRVCSIDDGSKLIDSYVCGGMLEFWPCRSYICRDGSI
jgi:hypothetical protein